MTIQIRSSIICLILAGVVLFGQEPPKNNRSGDAVSIVRSDAASPITIENRLNGKWQAQKIEPDNDATVAGDRIRVATIREDNAVITIEFPIQAGKKYRLFWNMQSNMWDFKVSP